ncbi:hypothetical protein [Photobacterium damselae]|uniref:hypothetical protein n=1 Tax=Photobacterium damselae TaxID=38293 RepID=UPI001F41C981|nr:hypothetical protein [Photobacterium damselae]UKA04981.1 hypothetical protein IHC89_22305 [Photobacterium damselae subsp. damselae]
MYRYEMEKTKSKAILKVNLFLRDGGELLFKCPHCGNIRGIDEEDGLQTLDGEQYQCGCDGWFEVDANARLTKNIEDIENVPCEPFKLYDCDYSEKE